MSIRRPDPAGSTRQYRRGAVMGLTVAEAFMLLAFILPVALPGPVSSIPDRLAGWGLASAASLAAISLLWPAPTREPLRGAAVTA